MDPTSLSLNNTLSVSHPKFCPSTRTSDQELPVATWNNARTLPEPPSFAGLDEELPVPAACALHFLDDSKSLVVSYVDHGIVYAFLTSCLIPWIYG